MTIRSTHTYVEMEVSAAAYDEIAAKMRAAEYDHAFIDDAIDMHGIGLIKAPCEAVTRNVRAVLDPARGSIHSQEVFYNKLGSTGAIVCSCGFAVTFTNIGTDPERDGWRFFASMHEKHCRPQA